MLRTSCQAKAAVSPKAKKIAPNEKTSLPKEENSTYPEVISKVVERNIQRCFKGTVPSAAIDVVKVNGCTMREQVCKDRVAVRSAAG